MNTDIAWILCAALFFKILPFSRTFFTNSNIFIETELILVSNFGFWSNLQSSNLVFQLYGNINNHRKLLLVQNQREKQ